MMRAGFTVFMIVLLAACGGGGGGGGESVRPDPPPAATPPPAPEPGPEPEPEPPPIDAHLVLTGARDAHGDGITGQGIGIAVVDAGVRRDHPALTGRVTHNFSYVDPGANDLTVDDAAGHGTMVSQIAAGKPVGQWPGGVAPGATIVSARVIPDTPEAGGSEPSVEGISAGELGIVHQDLINAGAMIMNNSWSADWTGDDVAASFADAYRPFIIDHGGIVVFATGNDSAQQPSAIASLPSQGASASILERGWLATAAVDSNNPSELARYSNACGIAMDYCLVAPGDVVVTGDADGPADPTYWAVSGTSFAAPQVSGAAALVWEKFDYFDNDLVRQTLLGSATDLGAPGVDPVFGHGLLNISMAMRGPSQLDWGDVHVRPSSSINSPWWNDISGAGGLFVDGGGNIIDGVDDPTLSLQGDHTFTGGLSITNGATMSVNGSMRSAISIDPTSYLYAWEVTLHADVTNSGVLLINTPVYIAAPTIFKGDIVNNGVLFNGAFPNTTFEGSFLQGSLGSYRTRLGNEPLHFRGSAQLDGTLHIWEVADGYIASHDTEVLIADGGVTGRFSAWSVSPGILLDATIGYGPDRVWLDVDRVDVAAVDGMAYTASTMSAARRVEDSFVHLDEQLSGGFVGGSDASVDTHEFSMAAGKLQRSENLDALERSLESLSGEMHGADTAFAMMAIEGSRHALESRLDQVGERPLTGAWADRLGGQRSMGSHTRLDANGWMLGHDSRLGQHLTLGAAFGQVDGIASHDGRGDRERNRQSELQGYLSWSHAGNYLLGRIAVGSMDRWLQRDILLGSERFGVDAKYDNRYTTVGVQAGHRFEWDDITLTPYLGTQSLQLDREGFSEQGAAGFGLSTHGSRLDATRALAGARLEQDWLIGAAKVSLQGRLEWQRTLSQSGHAIDARFTGMDVWSPITGAGLGEDAAVLGFGVHAWLPVGGKLGFELDSRRENGRSYTGAFANWSVGF